MAVEKYYWDYYGYSDNKGEKLVLNRNGADVCQYNSSGNNSDKSGEKIHLPFDIREKSQGVTEDVNRSDCAQKNQIPKKIIFRNMLVVFFDFFEGNKFSNKTGAIFSGNPKRQH